MLPEKGRKMIYHEPKSNHTSATAQHGVHHTIENGDFHGCRIFLTLAICFACKVGDFGENVAVMTHSKCDAMSRE
jgi:hypothetical protein